MHITLCLCIFVLNEKLPIFADKTEKMVSKNQIKWVKSLELKKNRKKEGRFVAEGPKVVGDLLRGGFRPCHIFNVQGTPAPDSNCPITPVTEDELRRLSFLQHPQEILAVFDIPADADCRLDSKALSLALDGIQDPGNLGTIIRLADWFGIKDIYCSFETADAYNPKVVQATMGSLAHVRIHYCNLKELLKDAGCPVYGTLLDGDNIYQKTLTKNGVIVMGNEGNGISPDVRALVTEKLFIPNFSVSNEKAESLNVAIATAVTCSEFLRR